DLVEEIIDILGFQHVHDLGQYLGVPLLHQRIIKGTLSFLVDRVRRKLSSWEAKKLSFAGRVTLVQSIPLSIPRYLMQTLMVPTRICNDIERMVQPFIWGCSGDNSKMTLVGGEAICQPRSRGGFGIRYLTKYGITDRLPECILRSRNSFLWKSISKVWPLLFDNLIWAVGNGNNVRCWENAWVPNLRPLKRLVLAHANVNQEHKLKDIIQHIVSVPPPMPSARPDSIYWSRSKTSTFSIKIAYWLLKKDSWNPNNEIWKLTWKYLGPQRSLLSELGVTLKGKALVWCDSSAAVAVAGNPVMHSKFKHVELDLFFVQEKVAQGLFQVGHVPSHDQVADTTFFSSSLIDWLSSNLEDHVGRNDRDLSWACLFSLLFSLCTIFPMYGFYLNTDGAVQTNIGLSATGGVIRDNMGKWILGYNRFLEKCSVFTAELFGLLDGLTLLQKQGYDRVLIQLDNLEMVKTICDRKLDRSNISLVGRI
ncbi:hypothetical protein Golax_002568, partial [Gossypium laxum]|nr:hypothetical protein [Gossypium laxum]